MHESQSVKQSKSNGPHVHGTSRAREKDISPMGEAAAPAESSHLNKEEEELGDGSTDWEAYLGSQRSRTTFAQYYRCSPMSHLGTETAADYDDGNRVVMAPSALDRLGSLKVEYPLVFKIQNAASLQTTHVGVQEFVAEEGFVHVPTHTMALLGLHAADEDGELVLLTSASLPKATSIKLRPHTSDFHRVKYPKELLEYNFGKYWCLTVGDTVTVTEGDALYLLDVVEAQPADAVATYETDCEVDFLPRLDYEEPAPPPPARVSAPWTETKVVTVRPGEVATLDFKPPTEMASGRVQQGQRFGAAVRMDGTTVEAPAEMANSRGQGQFSGVAVRMDGTRVEPAPPVEPAAAGSSAKGKRVTNGLRFGGAASVSATVKGGKKADAGEKDKEAGRFTGQTYSMGD